MIFAKNKFNKIKPRRLGQRRFVYSKKTYANPFFRRKNTSFGIKTGGFLPNRIKLAGFAAFILILILIWLLFFSSLFKINKIEITGLSDSAAKEIESAARQVGADRLLGKNNLLLYNNGELSRILNDRYFLENLSIKKKLFHTLIIAVKEKEQTAFWREGENYFCLDGDGNIINQIDPLNINRAAYPLIENLTEIKVEERRANIDRPTIEYITALFNEFKSKKHGFEIEKFIVDKNINTVKMAVLSGPQIFFNTKEEMPKQAAALDLIIKESLKNNFMEKEYINLRYGNNIYIK